MKYILLLISILSLFVLSCKKEEQVINPAFAISPGTIDPECFWKEDSILKNNSEFIEKILSDVKTGKIIAYNPNSLFDEIFSVQTIKQMLCHTDTVFVSNYNGDGFDIVSYTIVFTANDVKKVDVRKLFNDRLIRLWRNEYNDDGTVRAIMPFIYIKQPA